MSCILSAHEKSAEHIYIFHEWKELDIRLAFQNTIDGDALAKSVAGVDYS